MSEWIKPEEGSRKSISQVPNHLPESKPKIRTLHNSEIGRLFQMLNPYY